MIRRDATLEEYIYCFVLLNICYFGGFVFRKNKTATSIGWICVFLFSLTSYYDSDYFEYWESFDRYVNGKDLELKESFYLFFYSISLDSYLLFRTYVWGTALFLFYKTTKLYNLKCNPAIYIFILFFIMKFSYARASLGMAIFYYGLSYLLVKKRKLPTIIKGIIFILASFAAHRSMALLILLSPLIFFKLNRKILFIVLLSIPITSTIISLIFEDLANGMTILSDNGMFENFNKSAISYANMASEVEYNWKFMLVRYLGFSAYYLCFFCIILLYIKNRKALGSDSALVVFVLVLLSISIILLLSNTLGSSIIGYRILFMTSIPICIMLTTLYTNGSINNLKLILITMPAVLSNEGFLLGKIISMM